jgi:protein-disulfide isomerase
MNKVLALLMIVFASQAFGEDDSVSKQLAEILKELQEIRRTLEKPPGTQQPRTAKMSFDISKLPSIGSDTAKVAIVEFTDYQCPFCRRFFDSTFKNIQESYIGTDKVRFFVANLPSEKHANAMLAAQAGQCSVTQGKFWPMHEHMQSNPDQLEQASLMSYAQSLGMVPADFKQCLNNDKVKEEVRKTASSIQGQGVTGTPSFLVGNVKSGIVEGELIVGAVSFGVFQNALAKLLTPSPLTSPSAVQVH